ncbi:uncharacterized protein LOC126734994 [Anthonomus grandis grandis]|uniref:uncharacterized protein LOC126734994 n=1 Tax=Anthonomus grandis grandis TaxID=2921223 RepID=UPI002166BB01|nr:uncharacterized protein LOC126734994 [Anthonomus grandis grandis]XP_050294819.1 uncharacterized protein LOC126734994 [Anthonomus grandis grandis]
MDLQEDVYRLKEMLPNVDQKTIVSSLSKNNNHALETLRDFMLRDISDMGAVQQGDKSNADYMCVRHFLPNISEARIKEVLDVVGNIPNRVYIAVKIIVFLLDGKENQSQEGVGNMAVKLDLAETATRGLDLDETNNLTQINTGLKHGLKRNTDINSNTSQTMDPSTSTHQEPLPTKKLKLRDIAFDRTDASDIISRGHIIEDITNNVPKNLIVDQPEAKVLPNPSDPFDFLEFNRDEIILPLNNAKENPESVDLDDILKDLNTSSPEPVMQFTPPNSTEPSTITETTTSVRPIVAPPKLVIADTSNKSRRQVIKTLNPIQSTSTWVVPPMPSTSSSSQVSALNIMSFQPHVDKQLTNKVKEMFPLALPEYISQVCAGRTLNAQTFNEVVDIILSTDYPTRPKKEPSPDRECDPEEQLAMLQSLLPDADPNYLRLQIDQIGMDQERLGTFVDQAIVKKDYPTKKEAEIKQQLSAQQSQYTTDFNVDRFLEIFPDPKSVFEDADRKPTANKGSTVDKAYIVYVVRIIFNDLYATDLHKQLAKVNLSSCNMYNLMKTIEAFRTTALRKVIKKSTVDSRYRPLCPNIPLLQECAYFEHKTEILKRLEAKRQQLEQSRANAKELGLLETCGCCYDDEVMPQDILTCPSGCRFCRDCIRRSAEVAFGDGKLDIICFTPNCDQEFSLQVLQNVLTPKLFSKLAQKKALAEVKAAGIEDLETCPFCDFANIPTPEDKIFRCLNPDCMKESCRACKEPSHLPLSCNEVEKDEDVKNRIYIENKMTEALIRQCYKCSAKFIKEEGCNKMTCSCGAIMCYICRQPVLNGYKHFNGQGGDRYDLCPLYTDNFTVNEKNVLQAAEMAKKEIDPKKLKHDPTADLETHFKEKIQEHQKSETHRHANIPGQHGRHHGAMPNLVFHAHLARQRQHPPHHRRGARHHHFLENPEVQNALIEIRRRANQQRQLLNDVQREHEYDL